MSETDLVAILLRLLREVQEMSGREVAELSENDVPIGEMADFDSLNGIEVTMMLANELKCEIPGDVNLFVSKDGRKALTVRQIAARIKELLPAI